MRTSTLFVSLALATSLTSCMKMNDNDNQAVSSSSSSVAQLDEKQTATAVLDALMKKDIATFATFVSPKKGVRFTPETHVRPMADGETPDQLIYADQLVDLYAANTIKIWGMADGSGQDIKLTFAQYVSKYVTDHDYRKAPTVTWNQESNHGSTIDNAKAVYPNSQIVEYYFPGFDEQYGGMDWAALRLVLEKDANGKWNVLGVIHDHWTP